MAEHPNRIAVVRAVEWMTSEDREALATTLDYSSATDLYEKLRQRLIEDGAPESLLNS